MVGVKGKIKSNNCKWIYLLAAGFIFIHFAFINAEDNLKTRLYLLKKGTYTYEINVSDLNSGIYFYKTAFDRQEKTLKMLVQK